MSTLIREVRKQKNMTQQELADKCGIKREMIARYELGTSSPNVSTLMKIAKALNVKLDSLVNSK